jgi:hypothetical protein
MVKRKTTKSTRRVKKASKPARTMKPKARKSSRLAKGPRYSHDDPTLGAGDGGLTVWSLQEMAQRNQFNELNKLFDNGLTMDQLPVGIAAGAGVPVLDFGSKLIAKVLDYITIDSKYFKVDSKQLLGDWLDYIVGQNWRGKIFFPSTNGRASEGRNRIRAFIAVPRSPIVPMCRFDTMLLDSHPLARGAASNVVVLNYANPQTRPYWLELLFSKLHVYDVQVAVRGKYGPIFIGKTWLGKYDKNGEFTAFDPNQTVAWYFLDFNDAALKEQREEHWDGSDEELLDPMPHVGNLSPADLKLDVPFWFIGRSKR